MTTINLTLQADADATEIAIIRSTLRTKMVIAMSNIELHRNGSVSAVGTLIGWQDYSALLTAVYRLDGSALIAATMPTYKYE